MDDRFKLVSRRFIAWFLIGVAGVAALFMIVWGAMVGPESLAIMGGTALFTELGAVVAFYFAKDSL